MNEKYTLSLLDSIDGISRKPLFLCSFVNRMSRCNGLNRGLLLCLLLSTATARIPAFGRSVGNEEPGNQAYHSSVSEVRLVMFATDEHNRPVEDIQKDDFAVVDDDRVIRNFRSFTRSAAVKLDVIVLFDSSESVLPHFKQEISTVLQLIYQWPWNPEDDVSVLSFSGTEAHSVCSGDCRSSLTVERASSAPRGGSTPLFDALDTATSLLGKRRQPDVWPVIILFSDGDDSISKTSFKTVLDKTLASEIQIYSINVYSVNVGKPGQLSNGYATLQTLATASGGRYLSLDEGAVKIFSDVIDDLHSARIVTYALPPSTSDFHSIRILPTHNLNLKFRSRRGYYHPSSTSAY